MKETLQGTALLLAVTCGLLAWFLAGANPSWAQNEAALDICLNSERELVVRVEACRNAAEQGHALAQFRLGFMYGTGSGVPQDDGEAVKWYRLAADQGGALAQFNLGVMYSTGEGVPQNYIQAHMWLNLAGARGNEKTRKARDIVKDKMTTEQIAEAQRLASVWKPGMVIDAPGPNV